MSKELKALENLYRELACGDTTNVEGFDYSKANKYYHIIENALKNYNKMLSENNCQSCKYFRKDKDLITLFKILKNGFYYFTRYGIIKHAEQAKIGNTYVESYKVRFLISDLNKTWFINKAECSCAVAKYISSLPVLVSVVKKISKLTKKDTIWYKDDDGKVKCFVLDDYESFYYLPTEQCLECYYDYDNGLYCEGRAEEFPLSEYGKTWALTKEELK